MHKRIIQPMSAGRVLSAVNETRIREARASLDSVLASLEVEMQEDAGLLQHMNRAALKPGHVRINQTDRSAEIKIYGDIGGGWFDEGITAESISNQIDALDVDELNVRINSGGGLVFEGIAIYNAIARHNANVIVHIDGIAASIASVIAMAGDEIRISEGSHLMIHKPWSGLFGDATDLRKEADVLDKLEAGIIDIYAARTNTKRADIQAWVNAETWFLGQEAVDAGFADEMIAAKKKKPAASAMLLAFKNAPQVLIASTETPEIREFENFLRDGEGLSHSQAKRIAAMASRGLDRDDPAEPQIKPLRDVGGESADAANSVASRLAQSISTFASTFKE